MARPPATEHGDPAYARRTRCPCTPCVENKRAFARNYSYHRQMHGKKMVDAEPVRRHVLSLLDQGATREQIQRAAGLRSNSVINLLDGTKGRPPALTLSPPVASGLLSVSLAMCPSSERLHPNIGIRRRFQALQYQGHSADQIGAALGITKHSVYGQVNVEKNLGRTIEAFHEAYVELRDVDGGSSITRWRAYRNGWAPPWSWDDERLDLEDGRPVGPVCVVETCYRTARVRNLCSDHNPLVPSEGPTSDYRRTILWLGRRAA